MSKPKDTYPIGRLPIPSWMMAAPLSPPEPAPQPEAALQPAARPPEPAPSAIVAEPVDADPPFAARHRSTALYLSPADLPSKY